MRAKSWLKVLPIVAVLCVVSLPAYAQQQGSSQQTGDPVADAARKAREQKKNAQKPKKVYTEDDVSTGPVAGGGDDYSHRSTSPDIRFVNRQSSGDDYSYTSLDACFVNRQCSGSDCGGPGTTGRRRGENRGSEQREGLAEALQRPKRQDCESGEGARHFGTRAGKVPGGILP